MKKIIIYFILGGAWLLGARAYASVTDIIKHDERKEIHSIDATVFAFTYQLMRKTEKIFQPMIAAPQETMQSLCGFPVPYARQVIYDYAVFHDDKLAQDVMIFSRALSLHGTQIIGPLTKQILQHLRAHRDLMERVHRLDLSADVVQALLMDETFKVDLLLSKVGAEITAAVFDTFHTGDTGKLDNLPDEIKIGLQKRCVSVSSFEDFRDQ
ncbi:hypothetical protein X471_00852 [Bartonella bacilliformis str. Heidi Mejia]|uniref:DUF2059 domain-containing protein n=1 Tax=Bartonella bacilliformis INS TaxID=1206782 RepID=A0ABN0II18_BARBA|nr:hypothetical protein [Bartonella bacilliformis]AMG85338.1 hypothetical protein AL467_00695 [Bartonella bacilliformis]EKS46003.1 hypothetical protein BbINS_00525 [Bartonella bacilliformis INS]EYS88758.1 hypothetical protein X472_00845 [Bartonella bacilliformis San Pedro600-02]EYS90720.1 hypothetical protein X471_00852 [Bartonella bacilliformis str. Heidi Mejia]EYS95460.1 hypothetical protein X470_00048 [Bartonella bacilliformis Peru-18]